MSEEEFIYTLFDEENNAVIVCCLLCGASLTADMDEDDGEGVQIVLRHKNDCALGMSRTAKMH